MTSNNRRPAVFAVAQNQSSIESDEPQQRLMTPHFGILCLSALFSALGFSSVIPTVARFVVTDLNGGDVEVGLALGVFSFSAVLARPWIGRLGDRRGRRLLIAGGSFITAGVLAAHAFADSYSTLLIARLLMGAVQGAFFVGTVTLTTDLAPEHRRGEAASYFSVAIYGGMAFGPWLGEWAVGRWGFDGGFMVGGLCMGLAAIVACWLPDFVGSQPAQVLTTKQPTQSSLLYRAAIWPGIVMALGIMIFPALHGFMPKLMDERALGEAGPIYALYGLLVLALRLLCSRLPDTLGTTRTAALALVGSSVGMVVMGSFVTRPGLFVGAAILAIGGSLLYPALMVAAVDGVPENERAQAMSTFTMFFELSGGIGGPVLGIVAWMSGTTVAAFYGAAILAASGLPVLYAWKSRNPKIT